MSKTFKFQAIIISEFRDQCPGYSETFIYTLLALTEAYNDFPEISHFVNNLGRPSEITLT